MLDDAWKLFEIQAFDLIIQAFDLIQYFNISVALLYYRSIAMYRATSKQNAIC